MSPRIIYFTKEQCKILYLKSACYSTLHHLGESNATHYNTDLITLTLAPKLNRFETKKKNSIENVSLLHSSSNVVILWKWRCWKFFLEVQMYIWSGHQPFAHIKVFFSLFWCLWFATRYVSITLKLWQVNAMWHFVKVLHTISMQLINYILLSGVLSKLDLLVIAYLSKIINED